jgi:hypothetical protein
VHRSGDRRNIDFILSTYQMLARLEAIHIKYISKAYRMHIECISNAYQMHIKSTSISGCSSSSYFFPTNPPPDAVVQIKDKNKTTTSPPMPPASRRPTTHNSIRITGSPDHQSDTRPAEQHGRNIVSMPAGRSPSSKPSNAPSVTFATPLETLRGEAEMSRTSIAEERPGMCCSSG